MTILLCDIIARSGSCFQLASKCAGLWCEMAGLAAALFSAQLASQKNHRETAEAYHFFFFCSICMSLQSDSLPSASFDHKTALGEKKISG